jgi:hypothetical protein
MRNGDGAYIQAYNAQAVVDEAHQIITAADVTDCAADCPSYTPMLDQAAANTGAHPREALVDAGYCSDANLHAAAERQAAHGTTTYMATGRLAHDEQVPPAPRGRIPTGGAAEPAAAFTTRTTNIQDTPRSRPTRSLASP